MFEAQLCVFRRIIYFLSQCWNFKHTFCMFHSTAHIIHLEGKIEIFKMQHWWQIPLWNSNMHFWMLVMAHAKLPTLGRIRVCFPGQSSNLHHNYNLRWSTPTFKFCWCYIKWRKAYPFFGFYFHTNINTQLRTLLYNMRKEYRYSITKEYWGRILLF